MSVDNLQAAGHSWLVVPSKHDFFDLTGQKISGLTVKVETELNVVQSEV